MKKSDIPELHYVTSTRNVRSILRLGILCRSRVLELVPSFVDISAPGRQASRAQRSTPDDRPMTDYVNLFLNARNLTLKRWMKDHGIDALCVVRVDASVLDAPGVFVCSETPTRGDSKIRALEDGLNPISADDMFGTPKQPNGALAFKNHMPEILIPDKVAPGHIRGAYVGNLHAQRGLCEFDTDSFRVSIRGHLFGGQRFPERRR